MLHLVTLPGGTAPKAQVIGYSVGGKSGTAYKQEGKGYAKKKYRAWFVGMAPIAHPRIIVAVMVDEPTAGQYFGGDVAAPVFSEVVQQTLRTMGVPPDLDVKPQIIDARRCRPRRRVSDGGCRRMPRLESRDAVLAWLVRAARRALVVDSRRVAPATRSSPGPDSPPTAAASSRRARRRRGGLPGRGRRRRGVRRSSAMPRSPRCAA